MGMSGTDILCRSLLAPVVRGAENVPDGAVKERGCLFVGNHTQFGMYDLPFLMYELYLRGHKVQRPLRGPAVHLPCTPPAIMHGWPQAKHWRTGCQALP